MRKKPGDLRTDERSAPGADAKQGLDAKAREQSEKDAVARAVLEALRAHDSM